MNLTAKQRNVLNFISKFSISNSYPPTYSEIASEFNISTTTVQEYIEALIRKGYIEKSGGIARGLVIKNKSISNHAKVKNNVKLVPIIGHVTAGQPIYAHENILGYVSFECKGTAQNLFALHVKGDSMIGAGILNDDIVVAKPQRTAEAGEIVIALLGEEATVKRFQKDKAGYFLKPENKKYPAIRDDFKVLGRVIGLKRSNLA